ncbi:hypothetical protein B0A50_00529 [Salinomyces thailandicus]|uniref:Uncharacterized protein n=1 Tax=Salinomyces thailandicus TaxID=706561 RepID=A0A4U0UDV9_9PEZI|nr:hypothetical protein B0A50_00529 [Salinomyces thailandica]
MPPAVLADSDDDDEELTFDEGEKEQPLELGSTNVPAIDGTHEQSTGSTERLQRQIHSAQRALVPVSPKQPVVSNANSSHSPAMQANKRRHTSLPASQTGPSPQAGVKRRKTVKTYGGKRQPLPSAQNDNAFAAFREDAQAPSTSHPSNTQPKHPGSNGSTALPSESLQADFVNHEPNQMFRDTGSTEIDNESSQQRMIAQALSDRKAVSTSVTRAGESEEHGSSSFPWSASGQTPANGRLGRDVGMPGDGGAELLDDADVPHGEVAFGQTTSTVDVQPEVPGPQHGGNYKVLNKPSDQGAITRSDEVEVQASKQQLTKDPPTQTKEASWPEIIAKARETAAADKAATIVPPRSSPIVHINTAAFEPENLPDVGQQTSKESFRAGRKTVQDSERDLRNSDDIAVGLPAERYKPRPSKRRATTIDEEPIDYSVRPERAAKVRRAKTAAAAASYAPGEAVSRSNKHDKTVGTSLKAPETQAAKVDEVSTSETQAVIQESKKIDDHVSHHDTLDQVPAGDKPAMQRQQSEMMASQNDQKPEDDEIISKPPPKAKPKSSTRAKRAKTTLFEDHLTCHASQRTPSLSQQQAERKSARNEITNELATSRTQNKASKPLDEGEDDELALSAKGPDHAIDDNAEPGSGAAKRGKGRPPKRAHSKQIKSAERVLEDSAAESENEAEESPPKTKGRGRPPRAAKVQEANSTLQTEQDFESDLNAASEHDDLEHEVLANGGSRDRPSKAAVATQQEQSEHVTYNGETAETDRTTDPLAMHPPVAELTTAKTTKTANSGPTQAPTPSPEKTALPKSTPPNKGNATSHSPIQSNSKVPLRVGLSKRQRIPSLLRTMRPLKR